ncbi:MAG: MFS transporter [Candidatus Hodarchaeota archaeon]
MFEFLNTYLGIQELPDMAQKFVMKVFYSTTILGLFWTLSSAFFALFVIDIVGIELLGVLIAVSFILQAILDYPSGAFGDWIGQRWILFIGFSLEALAYITLFFANSFSTLLVAYILRAIAASQQSGAIGTWFDNNYKLIANESDPQRKVYKFLTGRWTAISNIIPGIATASGGILATIFYRQTVFLIQAVGLALLAIVFLIIVHDFPGIERPRRSIKNYFKLLGSGLRFAFFNKTMFFFLLGLCFSSTVVIIWVEMILFPVYLGYTGSDGGVGIMRLIVLLLGTVSIFFASKVATNMEITWIPSLTFIDTVIFYWGVAILTTWFPIDEKTFTPLAILSFILFYTPIYFFHGLKLILNSRFFLDSIPDHNRNSIYSLIPTLLLITSAPIAIIGGSLIKNLGISITALILGTIGLISVFFFSLSLKLKPVESSSEDFGFS